MIEKNGYGHGFIRGVASTLLGLMLLSLVFGLPGVFIVAMAIWVVASVWLLFFESKPSHKSQNVANGSN
jgi:hypothetical protein